jgi:hypothetical protein
MATSTPWGHSDSSEKFAPGIIFYSTPSHGGFHLSEKKLKEMPPVLRAIAHPRDGWFEEDSSWCAVPLSFPQFFKYEVTLQAKSILQRHYPHVYEELYGSSNQVTKSPESTPTGSVI